MFSFGSPRDVDPPVFLSTPRLLSSAVDNQTSAKAALTQMLNVVFQSMESATTQLAMTERKYREAHPEVLFCATPPLSLGEYAVKCFWCKFRF